MSKIGPVSADAHPAASLWTCDKAQSKMLVNTYGYRLNTGFRVYFVERDLHLQVLRDAEGLAAWPLDACLGGPPCYLPTRCVCNNTRCLRKGRLLRASFTDHSGRKKIRQSLTSLGYGEGEKLETSRNLYQRFCAD